MAEEVRAEAEATLKEVEAVTATTWSGGCTT